MHTHARRSSNFALWRHMRSILVRQTIARARTYLRDGLEGLGNVGFDSDEDVLEGEFRDGWERGEWLHAAAEDAAGGADDGARRRRCSRQ